VSRFRAHIALVLLLAFARVLVPDSLWLDLHDHEHTTREVAHEQPGKAKTVVDQQHTHCPTDHLFAAPALLPPTFAFGVVPPTRYVLPASEEVASLWPGRLVETLSLRGPPARPASPA